MLIDFIDEVESNTYASQPYSQILASVILLSLKEN